jgi:putative membrane protein
MQAFGAEQKSTAEISPTLQNTLLASERTLLAWVRTAISLIGFGFTIYKFFQYLREDIGSSLRPTAPRNLGISLIALGTVGLLVAAWQYRQFLKVNRITNRRYRWAPVYLLTNAIALIGILLIASILFHMGPY